MKDARLDGAARAVASAPLTFGWLLILFVTPGYSGRQGGGGRSGSNAAFDQPAAPDSEPSRVLATSLFWLDGRMWWPYVPMFVAVVGPAERRLRWWRWLLIGFAAHATGTFAGQGFLRWSLKRGSAEAVGECPRRNG